jgi:hypothetical protein
MATAAAKKKSVEVAFPDLIEEIRANLEGSNVGKVGVERNYVYVTDPETEVVKIKIDFISVVEVFKKKDGKIYYRMSDDDGYDMVSDIILAASFSKHGIESKP